MKTIIAGSRSILDMRTLSKAIADSGFKVTEVVSGAARGVDQLGEYWARRHQIPVKRFPAQWKLYGKSAGPRRNRAMARYADALIAIWNGSSPGTRNMIQTAREEGLLVHVHRTQLVDSEYFGKG